jgi:hypothetical protein
MRVQAKKGFFNPASDVVTIPGGFNNWLNEPPANTEKTMEDADGDTIYTKTLSLNSGERYEYKYNIGLGWDGKDELAGQPNRDITPTADVTLDPVFFNNEEMPSGNPANVTFEVDMKLPAKQNPADWSTRKVYVAGSFTDWQNAAIEMTDADNDSVFTVTTQVNSGQVIKYKFIHTLSDPASGSWETIADRESWITDGDQTISRFWDDQDPNVTLADGNILFQVDASLLDEIGLYDPAVDSMRVRGGFNGWGDSQPEKSFMNPDFLDANKWFLDVPFLQTEVNSTLEYKFRLQVSDPNSDLAGDAGYERPFSTGGGNRQVQFEGSAAQQVPEVYFNDIHPDFAIINQNLSITFRVNMTPATDPAKQPVPFNPATDRVFWQPGQAAFAVTQGWVEGQDTALELTDGDGDLIYEGTLNIQAPSFNGFLYSYQFVNQDGIVNEPTGFANNVRRVRYIAQTAARTFTQPYSAPVDTWTNAEDKSDQIEPYPPGYPVSVREYNGIVPGKFTLEQNFPNPFNPSTTIRFSIPEAGMVNLSVYNLLGEKVEEVMNRDMKAGSYEYTFDASNLSSGVYFYTIKTANYTASKKMILMK